MSYAKNEDRKVIELAKIQFGEGNHLFDEVVFVGELVDRLLVFARQNLDRAVEVRQFMDLHALHYKDPNHKMAEILLLKKVHDSRDRQYADNEFDDWSNDATVAQQGARHSRPRRSLWQRIKDHFL